MKKFYKIILGIFLIVSLSGCFGSDSENTENTNTSGTKPYETSYFSIQIPADWELLEKSDFTSNVPEETVVGFRNNIKNDLFTANINISISEVNKELTSLDLANSSKSNAKTSLIGFHEIKTSEITNGVLMEFEGKKNVTDPIIRFKQIYTVSDGKGYILTAAYLPNEDAGVLSYIEDMMNSFTLK